MNKIKLYIVPFLFLITIIAYSQDNKKSYSSFSKRIIENNAHLDSARKYEKTNPELSFDFALKALETAIKTKNQNDEAECYTIIGNINQRLSQYDLAIDNYKKASAIYELTNNTNGIEEINEHLAKTYAKSKELEKSEKIYKESAKKAVQEQDVKREKASRRKLASVYQQQGEGSKAIKELEEVRQMDISEGNIEEQKQTNEQLIDAYATQAPQRAMEISDENERLAEQSNDTVTLLNTLDKKADLFGSMGKPDEQLQALEKSAKMRKQTKDFKGLSDANIKISDVLMEQEKIDDAIAYLEETIDLSNKTGEIDIKKGALKRLSKAYDKSGNYNKALAVYREYVDASEKSAKQREEKILENLKLMQSLSSRLQRVNMLENEKQLSDKKIDLLQQENNIAEQSLKQQRFIIFSLIGGLLLLGIAVYLVYKSSRQKRIANQLLALRSLRSQMNPHFIFNALNSVNSYISISDERSANKFLADFSKLMRAVMENSKYDFVSLASEINILELYLKLEHHRFQEKFDYTFTVDDMIDAENIQIPPMLIQPYIENAIWHGLRYKEDKGYLKVELSGVNNLNILIEDNGIGRQKSLEIKTKNQQKTVSTGMKNITNRISIINSVHKKNIQVSIKDLNAEGGTVVEIVVPV